MTDLAMQDKTQLPVLQEQKKQPHKLDEVMLAMDVVDTLRHEQDMIADDLSGELREEKLMQRLREIYTAQGIDVPDSILREGVQALGDHRFVYTPYKGGLISKLYISRGKWGRPLIGFMALIFLAWGINYAAFEKPKQAKSARIERALAVELPKSLGAARQAALAIAANGEVKDIVQALYDRGMRAIETRDIKQAREMEKNLKVLRLDLNQDYNVRIVSRPGENSGVFRVDDDHANVRNYYLIVEAIDASGKRVEVEVSSQEDQSTRRTKIWGVRVPKSVFNGVAADKQDDQIIQNAIIGRKRRGTLKPEYAIKTIGGEAGAGLIVEW